VAGVSDAKAVSLSYSVCLTLRKPALFSKRSRIAGAVKHPDDRDVAAIGNLVDGVIAFEYDA